MTISNVLSLFDLVWFGFLFTRTITSFTFSYLAFALALILILTFSFLPLSYLWFHALHIQSTVDDSRQEK